VRGAGDAPNKVDRLTRRALAAEQGALLDFDLRHQLNTRTIMNAWSEFRRAPLSP